MGSSMPGLIVLVSGATRACRRMTSRMGSCKTRLIKSNGTKRGSRWARSWNSSFRSRWTAMASEIPRTAWYWRYRRSASWDGSIFSFTSQAYYTDPTLVQDGLLSEDRNIWSHHILRPMSPPRSEPTTNERPMSEHVDLLESHSCHRTQALPELTGLSPLR